MKGYILRDKEAEEEAKKARKAKNQRPVDSGALGTSAVWRTQVDQAKVYSRTSRLRRVCWGLAAKTSLRYCRFSLLLAAGVARGRVGDCQLDFSGFQRTCVTLVTGFWHNPGLLNDKNRTSKRTRRSHPDRQTNCGSIPGYSWRAGLQRDKKDRRICLTRFRQAGKAEEESAHGF
jgi:hypothetical protein